MKYFKNTELAKLYNISEKSVRNWIDAAKTGKLELQLNEINGKHYVSNTSSNSRVIEDLVQKGKKYKNTRGFRTINPDEDFYQSYTPEQILDIISNLTIYREIPTVYSYADGGAKYWDGYAQRLLGEQAPNLLNRTIDLLDDTSGYIERLIADHKRINVVDLGPGNGLPVRKTLERLVNAGKLNRYIAIDGSKEMLNILEHNVKEWFGDTVKFESHVRDFSNHPFQDLFAYDEVDEDGNVPTNLVLLFGSTLSNFRSPRMALQMINSSMGREDFLMYAGYLDTPNTQRYFDYMNGPTQKFRSELILSHIGIDDSMYTMEQFFDNEKRARFGSIMPKIDLCINFELAKGIRKVELRKNEPITVWRHWQKNAVELVQLFDQSDFDIMQATKSANEQYILITSKIKA